MIIKEPKYEIKDFSIVPSPVSNIDHRSEIDTCTSICGRYCLPVFVAPMADVTDEKNYKVWLKNKVTPVVPRSVQSNGLSFEDRLAIASDTFVSLSLTEAEGLYKYIGIGEGHKMYICIDIANGHMKKMLTIAKKLKDKFGFQIELMAGNIANPEAYPYYCDAGIDWCRLSIGSGSRCTTSCAEGTHYPLGSLIDEVHSYKVKRENIGKFTTKIIADGGINWFDIINKAIALGADAVMMGEMFAKCWEACGEVRYAASEWDFENGPSYSVDEYNEAKKLLPELYECHPYRMYAGMSHRSMQKLTGGDGSKISEGIVRPIEVVYHVEHLIELIDWYLRGAMSYANAENIHDFKEYTTLCILGSGDSQYRK
jgi:IMP dehydrogenase/GMP reductase